MHEEVAQAIACSALRPFECRAEPATVKTDTAAQGEPHTGASEGSIQRQAQMRSRAHAAQHVTECDYGTTERGWLLASVAIPSMHSAAAVDLNPETGVCAHQSTWPKSSVKIIRIKKVKSITSMSTSNYCMMLPFRT